MRIQAVLLISFFLLLPIPAAAEFVSIGPSNNCPKGTAGDPSGQAKSFTFSSSATEVRSYLYQRVVCPSACFDEAITLHVSLSGINVTVSAQNKCTKTPQDPRAQDAKKDNRGCSKGQTNPKVAVKITGFKEQSVPPKSRCDVSNLTHVINSVAEKRLSDALTGLDALARPIVGASAPPVQNAGMLRLSQVLNGQFDGSSPNARQTAQQALMLAGMSSGDAYRAIQAIASGDKEKADKIVAQYPDLNANLADASNLRPPVGDAIVYGSGDPDMSAAQNGTFNQSAASLSPTPNGEPIYRSDDKRLTFYVPHDAPGCDFSMEGCIATSRPNLTDGSRTPMSLDCVRIGQCQFVSLASDRSNYGKYYNVGTITYKSSDGNSYTLDNVIGYVHDTGSAFRGRPDKLDIATTICSGCSDRQASALASGGNVSVASNGIGVPDRTYGYSGPFASITSAEIGRPVNIGSPFGNVTPAPSGYFSSPPPPDTSGDTFNQGSQFPPRTVPPLPAQTGPTSIADQLLVALKGTPSAEGRSAIATVIAQPKEIVRGNPITVSWSTIGMSAEMPCILRAGSIVIAQKNQGSGVIPTGPATRPGSLVFTLACTALSGEKIQRTAATFVQ